MKKTTSNFDLSFSKSQYVKVHCTTTTEQASVDSIEIIKDYNELTNHLLNVIMADCIRRFGPLGPDELKEVEEGMKGGDVNRDQKMEEEKAGKLTDEEKNILEVIKKMKSEKLELVHDEIHDHLDGKLQFDQFTKLISSMVKKRILKNTSDGHYDIY